MFSGSLSKPLAFILLVEIINCQCIYELRTENLISVFFTVNLDEMASLTYKM
jgi:hypothetical protein